jgi:hypothetical protein
MRASFSLGRACLVAVILATALLGVACSAAHDGLQAQGHGVGTHVASATVPSPAPDAVRAAIRAEVSKVFGSRVETVTLGPPGDPRPYSAAGIQLLAAPSFREVADIFTEVHGLEPSRNVLSIDTVSPLKDGTGDVRYYTWFCTDSTTTAVLPPGRSPAYSVFVSRGRATRPVLYRDTLVLNTVAHASGMTPARMSQVASGTREANSLDLH